MYNFLVFLTNNYHILIFTFNFKCNKLLVYLFFCLYMTCYGARFMISLTSFSFVTLQVLPVCLFIVQLRLAFALSSLQYYFHFLLVNIFSQLIQLRFCYKEILLCLYDLLWVRQIYLYNSLFSIVYFLLLKRNYLIYKLSCMMKC